MRSQLKQLSFHRDAKISENRDDDKNVLKFRQSLREQFHEFVKDHEKSDPENLAEESLTKFWNLAKKLEKSLRSEISPDHSHDKNFSSSQETKTNIKTRKNKIEEKDPQFIRIGIRKFTSSHITKVSFRQEYHHVPVYNSLSVVEVKVDGDGKDIVSIQSSLIEKIENKGEEVPSKASLKQEDLKSLIEKKRAIHFADNVDLDPLLCYYFDSNKEKWRLVYVTDVKQVNSHPPKPAEDEVDLDYMNMVNYVVDAHSEEIVGELPCVRSLMALS